MHLVAYISGHGLGHATRTYPVMRELLEQGHKVTIVSNAPPFVFADLVADFGCERCLVRSSPAIDPSVVQSDAITIDVGRTFAGLATFLATSEETAANECVWLQSQAADLVYLDAPPLPARVAKLAGVPSVIVSNFTFDHILEMIDGADMHVVDSFRDMYRAATSVIKLPGDVGMDRWKTADGMHFEDAPLVARVCRNARPVVRQQLDLPQDACCLLITFGGFGISTRSAAVLDAATVLPDGWFGILVADPNLRCTPADRFRIIDHHTVYMPDIINASDVVLGKLGYGTCSEVVAHHVPLLFVSRPNFVEEDGLRDRLMNPFGAMLELAVGEFDRGKWAPSVLAAYALRQHRPSPVDHAAQTPLSGARMVASRLVEMSKKF
ncbi:hypothetical protein BC831DRAFT_481294 [Entophlyctis helioformis]|nr:hypothetical protein BC831DRAFT_481294 [Entophlyctis helioformis]